MRTLKIVTLLAVALCAAPLYPQTPELAGIAHVAFRVTDVAKSREFYGALGFEQSFEFADPGKPPVSYVKINDHQFIELYGRANDSRALGLMHICYEAADIEALWSEYFARGLSPPHAKKARAGNLLFTFRDPEGRLIEYTQYMPGSMHYEDRGKHLGGRRISEHLLGAAIKVKDVEAERAFYTEKLGFEGAGGEGAVRLRLPGNVKEEVELENAGPFSKAKIVFAVVDSRQTEKELRGRGSKVVARGEVVSVSDPDGVVIEFVVAGGAGRR